MALRKILEAWYFYLTRRPEVQELARKRLDVCESCPHHLQLDKLSLEPADGPVDSLLHLCALCGCPLKPMACQPEDSCKAGKWKGLNHSYF